ncbi:MULTISPECIES: Fic family protein [unclassified Methanoculleus]|uniref:Fic family protein n=1 Tax=unclassified Methanoculleus TaxID=2619537 RepID=UPI0025F03140|nr:MULTISPECIES: Fic family protein [unclassified Methanoculleus]
MERYPDNRAGVLILQEGGYDAFIPHPLPPGDLVLDEGLLYLLSKADSALARLDGVTQVLPNPDLFVAMYIKKEALLSSQIEGTQASLQGVLEFEAHIRPRDDINEIQEVLNYIKALHHGIEKLEFSPLSLDLINEIHRFLIQGTRGSHKLPGRLRRVQNWIGLPGGTIRDAVFVPPPPEQVPGLMQDLEQFIQSHDRTPTLVKAALLHAQLETIHPYLDGNGRMGRLMITFYLCSRDVLARPLLYLSYFLKKNREEYYTLLNGIRYQGNWEAWLEFFLQGVIEVSNNSIETAKRIIQLKETLIEKLLENNIGGVNAVKLIDTLFDHPIITIGQVMEELRISRQAATKLVGKFEDIGILEEITGKERYKQYMFVDYVRIIEEGTRI